MPKVTLGMSTLRQKAAAGAKRLLFLSSCGKARLNNKHRLKSQEIKANCISN